MRSANWKDYELIDASSGERLERWGKCYFNSAEIRRSFGILPEKIRPGNRRDARYIRPNTGGGNWQIWKKVPPVWKIHYGDLCFQLKTMGFKHTGIFPEQAVNWDFVIKKIKQANRPVKVLNLFGYTGPPLWPALWREHRFAMWMPRKEW